MVEPRRLRDRMNRCLPRDDSAVTVVIGTIMLAALFLAVLVMVQVNFVPIWTQDREATHIDSLAGQFADMRASLDAQVSGAGSKAAVSPLQLGSDESPFLLGQPLQGGGGSVQFTANSNPVWLNVTNFTSSTPITDISEPASALDENWVDFRNIPDNVTDIKDVISLRMRAIQPASADPGEYLRVTAYNMNNTFSGSFWFIVDDHAGSDDIFRVKSCRTITCTGPNQLYNQTLSFHSSVDPETIWSTSLLNPDYRFNLLLAVADKPLRLQFEVGHNSSRQNPKPIIGQYAIVYTTFADGGGGGGGTQVATTRENVTDYFAGGSLILATSNTAFPDQSFVLESGAFIVRQGNAVAMKVPPSMSVQTFFPGGGVQYTRFVLSIPSLIGTSGSVTSENVASVSTSVGNLTFLDGAATNFTLLVETKYPTVWQDAWANQLRLAGLSATNGDYTITTTPTGIRLAVGGLVHDGTTQDVLVSFRQAYLQVQLS
jgi:hypothetical protein